MPAAWATIILARLATSALDSHGAWRQGLYMKVAVLEITLGVPDMIAGKLAQSFLLLEF